MGSTPLIVVDGGWLVLILLFRIRHL